MGIKTKSFDQKAPTRSHKFAVTVVGTADDAMDATALVIGAWPYTAGGQIKDVICTQVVAGGGGTAIAFNVLKNGTTVLATNGAMTRAAGANKSTDLKGEITAIASCTRPVISATAANSKLAKGDVLTLTTTHTGTYTSTFPTYTVTVIVEGIQF